VSLIGLVIIDIEFGVLLVIYRYVECTVTPPLFLNLKLRPHNVNDIHLHKGPSVCGYGYGRTAVEVYEKQAKKKLSRKQRKQKRKKEKLEQ
jgi:hypothetical protein